MIVFKTFLKILKKNKFIIILYTVLLVGFAASNMKTSDNNMNFVATKPDVLIINNDEYEGITKNLIDYFENNSNIIDIKNDNESINDALFYRDVSYIIYIPKNFREEFLKGNNPKIEIKSTNDYEASLAEIMLERYIKTANIYVSSYDSEEEIIDNINNTLNLETKVEITSKLDTDNLSKLTFYYNFASYSIIAACVYVICLILSSFKNKTINKRTVISSMNYKEFNRKLLLSNSLFALTLWLFYCLISIILIGNMVFSPHGLLYILNTLTFTICALTLAFLIGNLVNNKNAINGIVNVIALGSSFLCGAFVPQVWLPEGVLKIAHILPTYWFIKSNELLKSLEVINMNTIKPVLINIMIILLFSLIFVIITNVISNKKRKM